MSVLLERLAKHGSVPLEGYGHQVGGHFLLMKFQDAAICKPLIEREHFFYETLPDDLKVFLPAYYGVIKVAFERQSSGEIQMVAYPPNGSISSTTQTTKIANYSLKASTGKSIHVGENSITSKRVDGGDSYVNPWSMECTKNTTRKLKQFGNQLEDLHQDYVVLENLTSKFSSPSILDLKVGTRQHGDDIPEEKKRKHMKTVAESTSSTLGVRICGMQKFDASKNEYIFRDKYYGRSLDDEGFYQELRTFLHNGVCFRSDLVPSLLGMVQELKSVIRGQSSYRFYSSSLLIIYDGAVVPELALSGNERMFVIRKELKASLNDEKGQQNDVEDDGLELTSRVTIDRIEEGASRPCAPTSSIPMETEDSELSQEAAMFSSSAHGLRDLMHVNPSAPFRRQHELDHDLPCHTHHKYHTPSSPTPTLLTNSASAAITDEEIARHMVDDASSNSRDHNGGIPVSPEAQSLSSVERETGQSLLLSTATISVPRGNIKNGFHHRISTSKSHHSTIQNRIGGALDFEVARKSVDIRMIDFAHSTHRGYNDAVQYNGPDEGYMLGVSSLVACFERMMESPS